MQVNDNIIAKYRIKRKFGRGGMGEVMLAEDNGFYGTVVVKTILSELLNETDIIRRFKRETRILSQLNHPHIVKIVYSDFDHKPPFYVMEYCEKGDLYKTLVDLDFEGILQHLLQAMEGVAFAHGKGVVHRDLKPSNLLIDANGVVKVSDFGLAMFLERDSTTLTSTNVGMGTPIYMPPEQLRNAKNVDYRADIYAFGIIMTEVLTGQLYSSKKNVERLIKSRFPTIDDEIARQAAIVINEATAFDPDERYDSMVRLIYETKQLIDNKTHIESMIDIDNFRSVFQSIKLNEFQILEAVFNRHVTDADYRGNEPQEPFDTIWKLKELKLLSGKDYHGETSDGDPIGGISNLVLTDLGLLINQIFKSINNNWLEIKNIYEFMNNAK